MIATSLLIEAFNKYFVLHIFEKNKLLTRSIVNDVIFDEKPYEMGIIQILIRE